MMIYTNPWPVPLSFPHECNHTTAHEADSMLMMQRETRKDFTKDTQLDTKKSMDSSTVVSLKSCTT